MKIEMKNIYISIFFLSDLPYNPGISELKALRFWRPNLFFLVLISSKQFFCEYPYDETSANLSKIPLNLGETLLRYSLIKATNIKKVGDWPKYQNKFCKTIFFCTFVCILTYFLGQKHEFPLGKLKILSQRLFCRLWIFCHCPQSAKKDPSNPFFRLVRV